MTHAVDESGFPLDVALRRLEDRLSVLAAEWRGAEDRPEHSDALVREYCATLEYLIELGWDASVGELDYEDMLPDHLMPEAYLQRYEHFSIPSRASE